MIRSGDLTNNAVGARSLTTRVAAVRTPSRAPVARPSIVDLGSHPEPSVTVAELARYWHVGTSTIYRDIFKGALAAFKLPGGAVRIKTDDARAYGRPVG